MVKIRSRAARQRAIALARLRALKKAKLQRAHDERRFGAAIRDLRERRAPLMLPPSQALARPEPSEVVPRAVQHDAVQLLDRPAEVYAGLPPGAQPLGAYMTRAEAMQALQQAAPTSGIATGLAIGLATVAVVGLGVVVCYLLFRKKDQPPQLAEAAPRVVEREIIREVPTYLPERRRRKKRTPATEEDPGMAPATTFGQGTTMRSFTLPSMADPYGEAVRIATGTDVPTMVVVRAVAPVGSYAVFSFSAAELNTPGVEQIPTGDTLLLVVGDQQKIKLAPKQALYGKGSSAGVIVSVLASDV